MKKIILILLFFTSFLNAQKIVVNKKDEFTQKTVTRTDWEKVIASSNIYLYARVSKINEMLYLELKFFPHGVSSIDTDDDISFMFNDGSIINLHSDKYKISNYGDASIGSMGSNALGLDVDCVMSNEDFDKFKAVLVKKIRINKSEGYSEDELKSKNSEKLKDMFLLF